MIDKTIQNSIDKIRKRLEDLYGPDFDIEYVIRVDPDDGRKPFGEYHGDRFTDNWDVLSAAFEFSLED